MHSNIVLGTQAIPNDVERFDPDKYQVITKDQVAIVTKPGETPPLYLAHELVKFHIMNAGSYSLSPFCLVVDSDVNTVVLEDGTQVLWSTLLRGSNLKFYDTPNTTTSVIQVHHNGKRQAYRYTLDNGVQFDVTPEHRFETVVDGKIVDFPIDTIWELDLPLLSPKKLPSTLPVTGQYNITHSPEGEELVYPDLLPGERLEHIISEEGCYAITSTGRVWSFNKKYDKGDPYQSHASAKWVQTSQDDRGYVVAYLSPGTNFDTRIHKLVAQHFIENPHLDSEVNHIDGDLTNNCVENLRWCTREFDQFFCSERGRQTGLPTPYVGVYHHTVRGWYAQVSPRGGSRFFIGWFNSPQEAADRYDQYVVGANFHLAPYYVPLNFSSVCSTPPQHHEIPVSDFSYLQSRIVSRENLGLREVADISVDNHDHKYLLNGYRTHNSMNWNQNSGIYTILAAFKKFTNTIVLSSCFPTDSDVNTVILANGEEVPWREVWRSVRYGEPVEIRDTPTSTVQVLKAMDNGFKNVYTLSLSTGKVLEATLDHVMLTRSQEGVVELPLVDIVENGYPLLSIPEASEAQFSNPIETLLFEEVSVLQCQFSGYRPVGDIEISSPSALYHNSGVIVHNCRVDAIARDPGLAELINQFGSRSLTVAVEGISERICNFLQKSLMTEEFFVGLDTIIRQNFSALKLYYIYTGLENQDDIAEFDERIRRLDEIRRRCGKPTFEIRLSITPLLSTLSTPLQYHGSKVSRSLKTGSHTLYQIKHICARYGFGVRLSTSLASSDWSQIAEFLDRRGQPMLEYLALNGAFSFPKLNIFFYEDAEEISREVHDRLVVANRLHIPARILTTWAEKVEYFVSEKDFSDHQERLDLKSVLLDSPSDQLRAEVEEFSKRAPTQDRYYRIKTVDKLSITKLYSILNSETLYPKYPIHILTDRLRSLHGKPFPQDLLDRFPSRRREQIRRAFLKLVEDEGEDYIGDVSGKKIYHMLTNVSVTDIAADVIKSWMPLFTNGVTFNDICDDKTALHIFPSMHVKFHHNKHLGQDFRQYSANKGFIFDSYCFNDALSKSVVGTSKVKVRIRDIVEEEKPTRYTSYEEYKSNFVQVHGIQLASGASLQRAVIGSKQP